MDSAKYILIFISGIIFFTIIGGAITVFATLVDPGQFTGGERNTPNQSPQTPLSTERYPEPPGIDNSSINPSIIVQTHLATIHNQSYRIAAIKYRPPNRVDASYSLQVNKSGAAVGTANNLDHPEQAELVTIDGKKFYARDSLNNTRTFVNPYLTSGYDIFHSVLENKSVDLAGVSRDRGVLVYTYQIKNGTDTTGELVLSENGKVFSVSGTTPGISTREGFRITYTNQSSPVETPEWAE